MSPPADLLDYWTVRRQSIDAALRQRFPEPGGSLQRISDAASYTLLAPGKRVRGLLALATNEALRGSETAALGLAGVVEIVHAASLILDDLPSMDNAMM